MQWEEGETVEERAEEETPSWFRLKAVAVHLYTASGVVLALLILAAAFHLANIERDGLGSLGDFRGNPGEMSMPRSQEIAAAMNRARSLRADSR